MTNQDSPQDSPVQKHQEPLCFSALFKSDFLDIFLPFRFRFRPLFYAITCMRYISQPNSAYIFTFLRSTEPLFANEGHRASVFRKFQIRRQESGVLCLSIRCIPQHVYHFMLNVFLFIPELWPCYQSRRSS